MSKSTLRAATRLVPWVVAAVSLFVGERTAAQLRQVGQEYGPGLWITRGDNDWHFSVIHGFTTTDEDFNVVSTTPLMTAEMRGLDWDSARQLMFYTSPFSQEVSWATLDGTTIGAFATNDFVNDLSVNPLTGDIWLAAFGGLVERVNTAGVVQQAFMAPFWLSGIAVDPEQNTLFLMRGDGDGGADGPLDDEIYEFTYDGTNLGLRVPASAFDGTNGLGLEYLPETNRLYTSGQFDERVLIFERVPEPTSVLLLLTGLCLLACAPRTRETPIQ